MSTTNTDPPSIPPPPPLAPQLKTVEESPTKNEENTGATNVPPPPPLTTGAPSPPPIEKTIPVPPPAPVVAPIPEVTEEEEKPKIETTPVAEDVRNVESTHLKPLDNQLNKSAEGSPVKEEIPSITQTTVVKTDPSPPKLATAPTQTPNKTLVKPIYATPMTISPSKNRISVTQN